MTSEFKVVFSTLYAEDVQFLELYIYNFERFTNDDCALIINLAPKVVADPNYRENLSSSNRVFVIADGASRLGKHGHYLLVGHIESFNWAAEKGISFEFFCTMASNCLFIRNFDVDAAVAALTATRHAAKFSMDDLPNHWFWPQIKAHPTFLPTLRDNWKLPTIDVGQIEGLFSHSADWSLIAARLDDVVSMGSRTENGNGFTFEEIIPTTVIINFGSREYTHIAELLYTQTTGAARLVTLNDLIYMEDYLPHHKCALKWCNRTGLSPETNALTTAWGDAALSAVRDALREKSVLTRHHVSVLLEGIARTLRETESARSDDDLGQIDNDNYTTLFHESLVARRQSIDVPNVDDAYVFLENTSDAVCLRLSLGRRTNGYAVGMISFPELGNASSIDIEGGGSSDKDKLQGYVYLRLETGDALRPLIRVTTTKSHGGSYNGYVGEVVFRVDEAYAPYMPHTTIINASGRADYYVLYLPAGASRSYIGLPFRSLSDFSCRVEIIVS